MNVSESESENSLESSDNSFINDESDEETIPVKVNKPNFKFNINIFNIYVVHFRKKVIEKLNLLKLLKKQNLPILINLLWLLRNLLKK